MPSQRLRTAQLKPTEGLSLVKPNEYIENIVSVRRNVVAASTAVDGGDSDAEEEGVNPGTVIAPNGRSGANFPLR